MFRHLKPENIEFLLNVVEYKVKEFSKDEIVAFEGDECDSISIILNGAVELQNMFPSGKIMTIATLEANDIFGEGLLFTKEHLYPVSVVAAKKSTIMFITKPDIVHVLTHHPIVLDNFLSLLSNKLFMMNKKVKILSFENIRQKICDFILKEYKHQGNKMIKIPMSKKTMAEHMAVQRPSLSREFIKMKDEGLIDFDKDYIKILDLEGIESVFY
jgi:CRP-like cAMP-binding protein